MGQRLRTARMLTNAAPTASFNVGTITGYTSKDQDETIAKTKFSALSARLLVNVIPVAAIDKAPTFGYSVTVSSISQDDDGIIASYDWDWGDSSTHSTSISSSHIYAVAGTYTITLVVTDDNGGVSNPTT